MTKIKRIISIILLNGIILFAGFFCAINLYLGIFEGRMKVCSRGANSGCYLATYQDHFPTFISMFFIYGIGFISIVGLYLWYFFRYRKNTKNSNPKESEH